MSNSRWPLLKLGECVQLISGGTPSMARPQLWDGGIPWVSSKDMKVLRLHDTEDHVSELALQEGARLVPEGTILMVVRSMILAKKAPISLTQRAMTFNQDIKAVIPTKNVDNHFLLYWLLARRSELIGIADEAAHGTKRLQTDRLLGLSIALPPLETQRRIASILSAYDDLIENNTRRIAILEEMAWRLYEEWFGAHRSSKRRDAGSLHKMKESFAEHVDFLEGPGLRNWQYREEGVPFLNIRTLVANDIETSKLQYLDPDEVSRKYRHFLLQPLDHVVSSSGTIGRIVTVQEFHLPLMLNTSIIRMRSKSQRVGRWLLKGFLRSSYFQDQINAVASGAAQKNFGPSHLKEMWVVAPPQTVAEEFERLAEPMEMLILALARASRLQRRTRDLLLPKLISGEIHVSDVPTAQQVGRKAQAA